MRRVARRDRPALDRFVALVARSAAPTRRGCRRQARGGVAVPERLALRLAHRLALASPGDAQLAALPRRGDLVAWVSATIARKLASAVPDLPSTAVAVRVSERTLQRRLAELGVSHSALLDEVRRGLALRYVTDTHLTMDPLHRAFERWTGTAPARYRRTARATTQRPSPVGLMPAPVRYSASRRY